MLLLSVMLVALAAPARAQQQYYVWDGSNLQPLFNTQGFICDHWAIWLYTDATTDPKPASGWGEIDGASAGEVQAKYQKERDWMERALASDHTGYEVHLGPVAIIKPPPQADNPLFSSALKEEDDLCDRLIKDFDFANQLLRAAKNFQGLYYQDQEGGYYLKPKSELQEYLNGLHDQMEKVNELRHKLNDIDGPALAEIQGELDSMSQSLAAIESQGQALANKLQRQSRSSDNTSWSGKIAYTQNGYYGTSLTTDGSDIRVYHYYYSQPASDSQPGQPAAPYNYDLIPLNIVTSAQLSQSGIEVILSFSSPVSCYLASNGSVYSSGTGPGTETIAFPTPDDAQNFLGYIKNHMGKSQ